jgi:hypothetical protein
MRCKNDGVRGLLEDLKFPRISEDFRVSRIAIDDDDAVAMFFMMRRQPSCYRFDDRRSKWIVKIADEFGWGRIE